MPNFNSKAKVIQVGNGAIVTIFSIFPIIITIFHMFEIYTMATEIHHTVD